MKPLSSTKRRWLMAASLTRWGAIGLLGCGFVALGLSVASDAASAGDGASQWTASRASANGAVVAPTTRPALVQLFASRSIRHRQVVEPPPSTQTAATNPTAVAEPVPPPPPPPFEVVATFAAAGGGRTAYVRTPNNAALLTWTVGSQEGPFVVTEISDGSVTLQAEEVRHTLQVLRRSRE